MYAISYRKRGFGFIFFPLLFLILSVGFYFLINYLLSTEDNPETVELRTMLQLANFLFGIFSFFLCLFLVPLGIILMFKKPAIIDHLPRSYDPLTDSEIRYIHDFSWGAFFGFFFWTLGNKLYHYTWQYLIPGWNIYIWLKLFIDGRKLAWEKGKWKNFRQFHLRQWMMMGIFMLLYGGMIYWISTQYSLEMVENKFGINIMELLEIK